MQIQKTNDGSHTLVSKEFGALYHSSHGSFQEAKHIFIENGIAALNQKEVTIFEMGFGSGLNAILTYFYAKANHLKVNYVSIEAYPVDFETIKQLNYNSFINEANFDAVFEKMHQVDWETPQEIDDFFTLTKINAKIEDFDFSKNYLEVFDIVYFDAFSPNDQENLWQEDVLQKMYDILKKDAFFITYCAKGNFKRCLKSLQFKVEPLPGPIGKREITKAVK